MKKVFSIIAALLLWGMTALAQKQLPANWYFTTLDNGLQLLVIEDNSVPLVTIEIAVHNGAFTEDSNYNGLSHLYEHMFFKANKDIPSQEAYLARLSELGITLGPSANGTTGDERVNYFITLNSSKLEDGLRFMNSAIRYPLFLPEEMKKENPVVDGEFQRAESNPAFSLFQDFNKRMWGDLVTRKNGIGIHDVILSATPEKMRTIQGKYYWPNNSVLAIAGDVKRADVETKVKAIYGDWKSSGFDPIEKWPIPEFKPLTQNQTFITLSPNARIPMVLMGWHGPDTRNDVKATYAADVFSFILSQSSSKFQQELVDSGLAYQVNVGYQTCKYVGPIQLFVVPNPTRIKECMKKVQEHISQWNTDNYFTDEQLETAKNQLAISEEYDRESSSSYIHTVTFWWASASVDYYTTYIDNLKKVTRQDIKDYVNKYITGKPMVAGVLLSPDLQKMTGITDFNQIMQ
ncbi:MAG: insulinase family protein [Chitinophagales bacterium]|nr:insulinase family protein [Chitinophagales bacterium]